jgi:hypothetical protein
MGQVGNWVFIAFLLPEGGNVSQMQNRSFLGRRVSLVNYHLLGPSAVSPSLSLFQTPRDRVAFF